MTNNLSHTFSKTYSHREWQTVAILGLIALSIVGYIFLVNLVVFHSVSKDRLTHQINDLTNEVTALGTTQLALGRRITLGLAYEHGFKDSNEILVSWRGYAQE